MRRIVLLVTVVALVAAILAAFAAPALAHPKATFTVKCKGFIIGQDEPFTQTLPENAREGSKKSIEQTNERSPEDKCKQSR